MKIAYLGAGTWGVCLATLLASKGHDVILWTASPEFADYLQKNRAHPKLPDLRIHDQILVTHRMEEALNGAELIIESVTSKGIRPVFEQAHSLGGVRCPVVVTSKGIEQKTGLLLPEVIEEVLGPSSRSLIGCLSGPSHAEELIQRLPSSVVSSSYDPELMVTISEVFNTPYFRVYPNADLNGVAFGGAMKNIIAIACGISDGLGFGDNTKAALMTRGLHEIRKLSLLKGAKPETMNGLAGLGDLCVTCLSKHSRNYRFGHLIAQGKDPASAKAEVQMVVEGVYTSLSAYELGKKWDIPLPITEAIHSIIYQGLEPREAVKALLQRSIKEEHL